MFKVLREVAENTTSGKRGETALQVGGRVRSPQIKEMLAKQLGQGLQELEENGQLDMKSGRIRAKAPKKEKSPEQVALGEAKQLFQKLLACRVRANWAPAKAEEDAERHPGLPGGDQAAQCHQQC